MIVYTPRWGNLVRDGVTSQPLLLKDGQVVVQVAGELLRSPRVAEDYRTMRMGEPGAVGSRPSG